MYSCVIKDTLLIVERKVIYQVEIVVFPLQGACNCEWNIHERIRNQACERYAQQLLLAHPRELGTFPRRCAPGDPKNVFPLPNILGRPFILYLPSLRQTFVSSQSVPAGFSQKNTLHPGMYLSSSFLQFYIKITTLRYIFHKNN